MLDIVIENASVVDGTGRARFGADVGIAGDTIVAVGRIADPACHRVDADGLVLSPGFVDVHTHYDVQGFWDTTLSPSPLHGVTTVIGGNCGFTVAPLSSSESGYLMRMLARVEGMPVASLERAVPWDWGTTAEYLDRLDGTLMPNAGFMVGHSALRRVVMGEAANQREAVPEEIDAMVALLRDGIAAGALGFSSSWGRAHTDAEGRPVPSRFAAASELISLSRVLRDFPGTSLAFIPNLSGDLLASATRLMTEMSLAARRPLNWNGFEISSDNVMQQQERLQMSDYAEERGARVLALAMADTVRLRLSFVSGFVLDMLPNWGSFFALPLAERREWLRDSTRRAQLDEWAQSNSELRHFSDWGSYRLRTESDQTRKFDGQLVADVAAQIGRSSWDALCDILIADDLRTSLFTMDRWQDDASWIRRVEVWTDRRAVIGASDAGAHLDMIDSFAYSTTVLSEAVRHRNLISLEDAVRLLTEVPATLYGLVRRGRVQQGWYADLVLFDPDRIAVQEVQLRNDLPGGEERMYAGADGVEAVFVNGQEVVGAGDFTAARPGVLLRSGRDTEGTWI